MGRAILLLWSLLAVMNAGCASVSIDSIPTDAEVGIILQGEEGVRVIGRTPFESALGDLDDLTNKGAVTLVVRKRGYLSQHFLIPNVPHADLKMSTNLLPDLPRNYEEVNHIVALILKGQRYLLEKRYDQALKVATEIKKENENIASAHEIEGAAYLLTNKLRDARFAWIRVLELEPENHEAKGMLALVETRMGVRKPAAKNAAAAKEVPPAGAKKPDPKQAP